MSLDILDLLGRSMLVGITASITVGPVAVLAIRRTLSRSRRSGIVSGLGIATADTLMAIAAYFFYALLQSKIDKYSALLGIIGGALVVVVGVCIFMQDPRKQLLHSRRKKSSHWREFISIFGLTLANFVVVIPYILAFFALFHVSSGGGESLEAMGNIARWMVVNMGFFAGSVMWWTLLATVVNLFRQQFRPRHMVTINHAAGVIIAGLGLYTTIVSLIEIF